MGANADGLGMGVVSPLTLGLVSCGGIGALLFTVAYSIEELTRPGYNAWQQPISALSLGPGGWVQQANFVIFGVLLVLSAVGWRWLLAPGRSAVAFPLIQGIAGGCLILAGLFTGDVLPGYPPGAIAEATGHGAVHAYAAYAFFAALVGACIALALRFAGEPRWRGWAAYSAMTAVVMLAFFAVFLLLIASGLGGFYERIAALAHALWSCLLVAALFWKRRSGGARAAAAKA